MPSKNDCPETSRWEKLLSGAAGAEEQAELAAHLEGCADCRRRLESLAGEGLALPLAGSPESPTAPELAEAMRRLKADSPEATRAMPASGTVPFSPGLLSPSNDPHHLGRLAGYEIVREIGRGGMGIVFKARDPKLERLVAVKVLGSELASSGAARKRFLQEAKAAAAILNEHVVTIHAVDECHDVPFLVMEYIVGVSLEDRLQRSGHLRVEEVLRIGMQMATGLAAAHAQGLVHLDIKPGNILLENGVERVKITDFGLARVLHEVQGTQSGVVAGTPQYMSPEQAEGGKVDPRSDLFSLGCVMYAMCTGRSPFRADTPLAAMHRVCDDTPRPIREVNPEIPEWLVAIVERLLAKDPGERFQTAREVAQLLGKYLAHLQQPSQVPPPAALRPMPKAWRKFAALPKWATIGGVACLAIVILAALALPPIWNKREVAESPDPSPTISETFTCVDLQSYANLPLGGQGEQNWPNCDLRDLKPGQLDVDGIPFAIGEKHVHLGGEGSPGFPNSVCGIKVDCLAQRIHFLHNSKWSDLSHGTTVSRYKMHYYDGSSETVGLELGRHLCWWGCRIGAMSYATQAKRAWTGNNPFAAQHQHFVQLFLYSWENPHPDKKIVSIDFERGPGKTPATFCVAITCDRRDDVPEPPPEPGLLAVSLSKDVGPVVIDGDQELHGSGNHEILLTTGPHVVEIRDSAKVLRRGTLRITAGARIDLAADTVRSLLPLKPQPDPLADLSGQNGGIWNLALSADGKTLATACGDGRVILWKLQAGVWTQGAVLEAHSQTVRAVAFAPKGELLVTGSLDGDVKLWDVASAKLIAGWRASDKGIYAAVFSPDGNTLATGGGDGSLVLWDAETQRRLANLLGHSSVVAWIAFSRDGRTLATAGWDDRTARVWDVAERKERCVLSGHTQQVHAVAFAPDDRTLATAGVEGIVRLWDAQTGRLLRRFEAESDVLGPLAFSPDGKTLAAGTEQILKLWDLATGNLVNDFHAHWNQIRCLAFSSDSATLVTAGLDGSVRLWDTSKRRPAFPKKCPVAPTFVLHGWPAPCWPMSLAVSSRGVLAGAEFGGVVDVWNLADQRPRAQFKVDDWMLRSLVFTPNGDELAACVNKNDWSSSQVALYGTKNYADSRRFKAGAACNGMAISSSGTKIITSHWGSEEVKYWNVEGGEAQWTAKSVYGKPFAPAISPDGALAAFGTEQGYILLVDTTTGKLSGKPLRHGKSEIFFVAFAPDGSALASASRDSTVKLWNLADRKELATLAGHTELVDYLAFSPNGKLLATAAGANLKSQHLWRHRGEVKLWDVATRRPLSEFESHMGSVACVLFIDDKTLVTTGADGKLRLWDVEELLKHGAEDNGKPEKK